MHSSMTEDERLAAVIISRAKQIEREGLSGPDALCTAVYEVKPSVDVVQVIAMRILSRYISNATDRRVRDSLRIYDI